MTVLYIAPESSALVHAAAAAVLYLHIGAGSVGLLSGTAAFVCRKGTPLHRLIGKIFVASMLIMSGIGAVVAPFLPTPERASVIAGILTFYLVLSSWMAVKRKPGQIGRFDYGLLLTSLSVIATSAYLFWLASQNPRGMLDGQPGAAFVMFMIIGSLAAVGDLRLILKRGVTGATRLARHLWRMTVALFIAANSLFLGQPQVFPKAVQKSGLLMVPALLILALLLFWLAHVAWGAHKRRRVSRI
ncbi:DUF2306 domain-containing protein [Roseateles oligotrophus]|uniref:DUF2306 domain-containing protein n=1 Tax=Roseateles oligotrophus TaxID=1769250 RepID=A0ABT2YL10_9BURK|nr:DUF2306 domain-containing protein [Roseateles oligotrophus]MCV2370747.1 DUF2306 domain-containing protein [Roseateles oligotrophus]